MHKKKIVLIGGFGWQDIGDEAMPEAVIMNLRRHISNIDIVMLSPNPNYTTSYHHERAIYDINHYLKSDLALSLLLRRTNNTLLIIIGKIVNKLIDRRLRYYYRVTYFLFVSRLYSWGIKIPIKQTAKMIIEELSTAQLLFNNGGGNINSLLSEEMYKQSVIMICASYFKVPIIVSGQTIGPITKILHRLIVRKALNNVNILTFRDKEVSMQRVKEIGVTKCELIDTSDDAVTLSFLGKEETEKLIFDNGGSDWLKIEAGLVVAVNMNGYIIAMEKKSIDDYTKELSLMGNLIKILIREYNAKILLIPTDYCVTSDDRPLLKILQNMSPDSTRLLLIHKEYNAVQYKSIIGYCDIAIGSRYHFIVFATSMGVPCVALANGIYQKTKLKGVLDIYELLDGFVEDDMENASEESVLKILKSHIEKKEMISSKLNVMQSHIEQKSLITIMRAKEFLEMQVC